MSQLSDMARVTITPQTVRSLETPMSHKKKQALRTELVIAYIKQKPYGQRIRMTEFMEVAKFKSDVGAYMFIRGLLDAGAIIRHEISPRTFFYTVPEEVKTVVPKARVIGMTAGVVEERAMRYSWDNPDFANDLREFVKWLKQHEE